MATRKGQESIEAKRRKLAAKLAVAKATEQEDFDKAVEIYKDMGYGDNDAKVAASVLRDKYSRELRKQIFAEVGLEDDEAFGEEADDEANEAADVDDEISEDDSVVLDDDVDEDQIGGIEEDAEGLEDFGGPDMESNEPVLEEENELPGEGTEIVERIEVPGGVLQVEFIPSGDNVEDLDSMGEEPVLGGPEDELEGDFEDDLGGFPEEEDSMAEESADLGGEGMPRDKEALLAKRSAERRAILASVERKQILADVVNENEKAEDKNLGDDTAHSGDGSGPSSTSFKMEDVEKLGVAGPGEDGKTMSLKGSEGNSLKKNPNYLYFDVPTDMMSTILQNENAKGRMKLDGKYGDLASQSVDFADSEVPTEGGEPSFQEFEVPTQLDTTKQRKVTVASSEDEEGQELTLDEVMADGKLRAAFEYLRDHKYASKAFARFAANQDKNKLRTKVANKECDAYEDNTDPVRVVECEDCSGRFVLSTSAINAEYCPGCQATIRKAVELVKQSSQKEATVDKQMWNEDWGDELCEAEGVSVTRDPNGDGGFKTQGKKGGAPKDKNAKDMEVDKGQFEKDAENEALRRTLAETTLENARRTEAYRTASKLVGAGLIDSSELEEKVEELLSPGMTVESMRLYGEQAVKLAQRTRKSVVAENSVSMTKTASSGLARNFSVSSMGEEAPSLVDRLKNAFTTPQVKSFDEDGRLRR